MSTLAAQKCEACNAEAPMVSDEELAELMSQLPDWAPISQDGILMLEREYKFKNFKTAQAFANQVGYMAEEEGHHPAILLEWGKVKVTWWTHAIKGLHKNDFVCAAKTDALFQS